MKVAPSILKTTGQTSNFVGVQADSDDEDLMLSVLDDVMPDDQLPISPTAALIRFQNENSDSDRPSQLSVLAD